MLLVISQVEQLWIFWEQLRQVLFSRIKPIWQVWQAMFVRQMLQPIWTTLQSLHSDFPWPTTWNVLSLQVRQKLPFEQVAQFAGQGWQRLLESRHWPLGHSPNALVQRMRVAMTRKSYSLDIMIFNKMLELQVRYNQFQVKSALFASSNYLGLHLLAAKTQPFGSIKKP